MLDKKRFDGAICLKPGSSVLINCKAETHHRPQTHRCGRKFLCVLLHSGLRKVPLWSEERGMLKHS